MRSVSRSLCFSWSEAMLVASSPSKDSRRARGGRTCCSWLVSLSERDAGRSAPVFQIICRYSLFDIGSSLVSGRSSSAERDDGARPGWAGGRFSDGMPCGTRSSPTPTPLRERQRPSKPKQRPTSSAPKSGFLPVSNSTKGGGLSTEFEFGTAAASKRPEGASSRSGPPSGSM